MTIDRADRMNALDSEVVDGLEASWKRFAESDDRVAILHATGDRAFSVGADIKDPPGELWRGVPSIGVALDKPVIAGPCTVWGIGGAYVIVPKVRSSCRLGNDSI
ncbi:MAG: hypothetical protein Ct9H300mP8_13090 [Gammaproteobacteria bacterium]|nr:MAG: hypothetical protein Ct9H300mP8_13090 [Gammaproteobacteria bacterium]